MDDPTECVHSCSEEETLRCEIALFESHLARISADDDCAYEKARLRAFEALLQERRSRLDILLAHAHRSPSR